MNKQEKIKNFNPNNIGQVNDGMYGLPFTLEESDTVLIPVPWEVTVSYGGGTAKGPEAILQASYQVDLYDPLVKDAWMKGIAMDELPIDMMANSDALRALAEKCIEAQANGAEPDSLKNDIDAIHAGCKWMIDQVYNKCLHYLQQNKHVGLVGGDHSTPLGMIKALGQLNKEFAILQIDAHADLRDAYEGFEFSHASIMFNALKEKAVSKLVQVGIRDYCEEELQLIQNSGGRVVTFFDRDIKRAEFNGDSWDRICNRIVATLPQNIYLSFDIDGLDPKLCPNTGTPVAGGFETEQVMYLLEKIVLSGRTIIAFDLNEVGVGETDWDANVAARILYRIANLAAFSQTKT
jgi:agmatinase